jgi:thiol-disulfide isomerase/thioredoxin
MRLLVSLVFLLGCVADPPQPNAVTRPGVLAEIEATRDLDGRLVGATDGPTLVIVFASWCPHCRDELVELDSIRSHHVRMLGVNYRGHEEYDHRGNSVAVRAFADRTPWLRVVPIDDAVFTALGSPAQIPTMYIFDRTGALVQTYDRRARKPPSRDELVAVLARLGA